MKSLEESQGKPESEKQNDNISKARPDQDSGPDSVSNEAGMVSRMESQGTPDNQSTTQVSRDSGPGSVSNEGGKISVKDVCHVQNLIKKCIQQCMAQDEAVKTLQDKERIDPVFTTIVWKKLEEQNADFFRVYNKSNIRLAVKEQITTFKNLLECQYLMMNNSAPPKAPPASLQSRPHTVTVNNFPIGYPILQPPPIPAAGQPHLYSMCHETSSTHAGSGISAPGSSQPMRPNSRNGMVMETNPVEAFVIPHSGGTTSPMADVPISPTSVASSAQILFNSSGIPEMKLDMPSLEACLESVIVALKSSFPNHNANSTISDGSAYPPSSSSILHDLPSQKDLDMAMRMDS